MLCFLVDMWTPDNAAVSCQRSVYTKFCTGPFIDGQALPPTVFGLFHPVTGQWRPKARGAIKAAVDAGNANSFFLSFDDPTNLTTLCADASSKGNHWTANNISLTAGPGYDSMQDSPTNNYCTLNALDRSRTDTLFLPVNGGLRVQSGVLSTWSSIRGTMSVSSGKWYWEYSFTGCTAADSGEEVRCGVAKTNAPLSGMAGVATTEYTFKINATKFNGNSTTAYGAALADGDIVGVDLDMDAGTLTFYKNGVSLGVAFSGLVGEFAPVFSASSLPYIQANFGQRPFAYSVPTGRKTLCTKNLPFPKIANPTTAFVAKTNSGSNIVSDLAAAATWDKWLRLYKRRDGAEGWIWQFWDDQPYMLDSSSSAGKSGVPALTGTSYVGYALRVGAAYGIATGTLTHTSGAADTLIDGLSTPRKMVILKCESAAGGAWFVYHPDLTAGKLLYLNSSAGETTDGSIFGVTATGFSVGATLPSGAYRWIALSEIDGFLKLAKHAGNSSADGPFVHAGMLPSFRFVKNIGTVGYSQVSDSARNPSNAVTKKVSFSSSLEENNATPSGGDTQNTCDFITGGWKIRDTDSPTNATGYSYVSLTIAATPQRYANAR